MAFNRRWQRSVFTAGLTLILVAYFLVWLPQPVAGLSFIGIDIGEWIKFIPQVQSGELGINRNVFYLPPITLSLILITWTVSWPERRWQTWILRFLAIIISFLSLPSIEAFTEESTGEWFTRTVLVLLVITFAILIPLHRYLPSVITTKGKWVLIGLISLLGAILPTWTYIVLREPVGHLFQADVGIGPGAWLNAVGHLIVTGMSIYHLISRDRQPIIIAPNGQEA